MAIPSESSDKLGNLRHVLRVYAVLYTLALTLMLLASVPAPEPYPTARMFRWVLVLPVLTDLASMGYLLAHKSGIAALTLILLIMCFFLYPYSLFWGDEPNALRRVLEKAVDGVMFLGFSFLTNAIVPEVVLRWRRG